MKSIAEDLNTTEEKATEIYNAVLTNISGLDILWNILKTFVVDTVM